MSIDIEECIEEAPPRFGCPECGCEDIDGWNSVLVKYRVTSWQDDGTPEDYGGTDDPAWETAETVSDGPQFQCEDCGHEFDTPKRIEDE